MSFPRPAARCTLFSCPPRKDGRAVPHSTKTRRGDGGALCGANVAAGRPAGRRSPPERDPPSQLRARGGGLSPHPPGRGCSARPREKCSPRVPGVCADILRSGGHRRVRDSTYSPRVVTRPCDTPTRVGTRVRRGDATRVCGHARAAHAEVADTPVPTDGRRPQVRITPSERTPASPQLRQPWGSRTPGTHSSAPSLPKFIGFVTPFPHSTQPTQLRAAAGARLPEAAAEAPPPASFPA